MEEKKIVVTSGTSLTTILGVAFLILKLVGVIDWAWVWVLSPFWIPIGAVIAICLIWFIIAIVVSIASAIINRW